MIHYRLTPFSARAPLRRPPTLPPVELPFVQQLRLYLSNAERSDRQPSYAMVMHDGETLCWLDARGDRMMSSLSSASALARLRTHLIEPASPLRIVIASHAAFEALSRAVICAPLRQSLWHLGLGDGDAAMHIAPLAADTYLRLRRWPDARLLDHRDDHFQICALLVRQGASALGCSRALDLPLPLVQAVFNAAFLSGYGYPVASTRAAIQRPATGRLKTLWQRVRLHWRFR